MLLVVEEIKRWPGGLTSYTSEKLTGETLYLTAWERNKLICLQKVENALTQKIGHNTDMVPKIEAVAQMYTLVPVLLVIL